jgi:GH43 family beta-xylosidase
MRKAIAFSILCLLLLAPVPVVQSQDREPTFVKAPADKPVIAAGLAGAPIFVTDPVVYTDAEGLHLFYTAIFCEKQGRPYFAWDPADQATCIIRTAGGAVGYAFSDDLGLTWTIRETPVIMPGPAEWDSEKIETPFVTRADDTLYLFYCATGDRDGQLFAQRYQIGVATLALGNRSVRQALLDDGAEMTKQSEPLVAYNLAEPAVDNNVQEPSVVVRDNGFELYFIGLGLALPDQGLDVPQQKITSINFMRMTFDDYFAPLDPPQVLSVNGLVNMPEVHDIDGTYYAFYTTSSAVEDDEFHHGEIIGSATSQDGLTWDNAGIILKPGADTSFDNWGVMAPTVSFQEDQTILFYTAWEMRSHPAFPVPPDGRFGAPISDDRTVHSNIGRAVSTTLR